MNYYISSSRMDDSRAVVDIVTVATLPDVAEQMVNHQDLVTSNSKGVSSQHGRHRHRHRRRHRDRHCRVDVALFAIRFAAAAAAAVTVRIRDFDVHNPLEVLERRAREVDVGRGLVQLRLQRKDKARKNSE